MTEVQGEPLNNEEWLAHLAAERRALVTAADTATAQLAISLGDPEGNAELISRRIAANEDGERGPLDLLTEEEKRNLPAARVIMDSLVKLFETRR